MPSADDLLKKAQAEQVVEHKPKGNAVELTVARVEEELRNAAGDIGYARIRLGVNLNKLESFMRDHPQLLCWFENRPRSWAEKYDAPAVNTPPMVSDAEEAEKFKANLIATGVKPVFIPRIMAVRDMAKQSFASTFELMHGGLTEVFLSNMQERKELLEMKREVQRRLREDTLSMEMRTQLFREMLMLGRQLREIGDEMIRTTDSTQRGALTLAAMRQTSKKKKKWRFSSSTDKHAIDTTLK
jgi:hypothetical protein